MMQDLAFGYKIAEHNPWVTGKIISVLKLYADNWQETYGKCENTDRDCVVVTCDYIKPSSSFWFVCDLETKLIVEGKYWRNNGRQGQPVCHADSFQYNVELDDETFNFKIPEGSNVIHRKNLKREKDLKEKAWKLFENKQYAESLGIYLKADDLFMAGICYANMGEYLKAIESYEELLLKKGVCEGASGPSATYFYLGSSYMQIGNKEKAIEAFKNCLLFGQGRRDPEAFPMKDARQGIEKLKSK
jgi:tetratricopeptide (TPR) repeat protein